MFRSVPVEFCSGGGRCPGGVRGYWYVDGVDWFDVRRFQPGELGSAIWLSKCLVVGVGDVLVGLSGDRTVGCIFAVSFGGKWSDGFVGISGELVAIFLNLSVVEVVHLIVVSLCVAFPVRLSEGQDFEVIVPELPAVVVFVGIPCWIFIRCVLCGVRFGPVVLFELSDVLFVLFRNCIRPEVLVFCVRIGLDVLCVLCGVPI